MKYISAILGAIGAFLGWFLGGFDSLIYALLAFVIIDYLTGVIKAILNKELSSLVGFRGLCRKVCIFCLVGIAHILDANIIGSGTALRTAVILFYMANEGISILENSAEIGLPIPQKLKDALAQLKTDSQEDAEELVSICSDEGCMIEYEDPEDEEKEKILVLDCDDYKITQGYSADHKGIDIVASADGKSRCAWITAHEDGLVTKVETDSSLSNYGIHVIINHGFYKTLYAHIKTGTIKVKEGDLVEQGQRIGYTGKTGKATGAHLHFEIRVNDNKIDPTPFLTKSYTGSLGS